MKNAKLKIKNEGEDGKWGNEEWPVFMVRNAPSASGAGQVHGLMFKVDPVRNWKCGVRNFEFLRLKTSFRPGVEMAEGGNFLATDAHGFTQIGTGADKQDFLTADKTGLARMEREKVWEDRACFELSQGTGLFHVATDIGMSGAQSMTMWAVLESWRSLARVEFELRGQGYGMSGRRLRFGGGCSVISTWFRAFLFFAAPTPVREGSGRQEHETRLNSLKLAKTLILKFFLKYEIGDWKWKDQIMDGLTPCNGV